MMQFHLSIIKIILQERKRDTWIHRRLDNLKDVANYFNMIKNNKELEHGKHFFIPPGLAAFTPLILKVSFKFSFNLDDL